MSLLAQAQRPDSPRQSRSTPVTGIDIAFKVEKKRRFTQSLFSILIGPFIKIWP